MNDFVCEGFEQVMKVANYSNHWFSEPVYIKNGEIKIACYAISPMGGSFTHTAVLCHGFPEIAYSWRFQVDMLLNLGFRVIIPDLRGYGRSDAPCQHELYHQSYLVDDLYKIFEYFHLHSVLLIGHDFGGTLCWKFAKDLPHLLCGLVVSSSPFPDYSVDVIKASELFFGKDNYLCFFQTEEAVRLLNRDVGRTIKFYFRRDVGYGTNLSISRKKDSHTMTHVHRIDQLEDVGEFFLSDVEFSFYRDSFSRSGFRGPISWYRTLSSETSDFLNKHVQSDFFDLPILSIGCELDYVVPSLSCSRIDDTLLDFTYKMIPGVGHWCNQENPVAYNSVVSGWALSKLFT